MQEIFYGLACVALVLWIAREVLTAYIHFSGAADPPADERPHMHVVPMGEIPDEVREVLREKLGSPKITMEDVEREKREEFTK